MLDDLEKDLYNVALAGIGAIAILSEKACELGKKCAEKGGETLEKGREFNDELIRRGEQIAAERKERAKREYVESLSAEERAELRRRLDELDAQDSRAQAEAQESESEKVIDIDSGRGEEPAPEDPGEE